MRTVFACQQRCVTNQPLTSSVSEVSIKSKEKKKFDETRKSKSDKKKEQKAREMVRFGGKFLIWVL